MDTLSGCKKNVLTVMAICFVLAALAVTIAYRCSVFSSNNTVSHSQARLSVYDAAMHPVGVVDSVMHRHILRNGGIKAIKLVSVGYHTTMYGREANVIGQILQRRRIDQKTGMPPTIYVVTVHLIHTPVGWRVDHWYRVRQCSGA